MERIVNQEWSSHEGRAGAGSEGAAVYGKGAVVAQEKVLVLLEIRLAVLSDRDPVEVPTHLRLTDECGSSCELKLRSVAFIAGSASRCRPFREEFAVVHEE